MNQSAILYQEHMMTETTQTKQHLISLFAEQPCWMIEPLATQLRYSIPSVRRFLVQTGYYSSFTHNGGWYTLRSIPRFANDGLWFYDDIGFSKIGSLTSTLIHLIQRSPSGMTAEQLGEKLRCRCHSVLVQLFRQGRLQRQKMGRSHVYLAIDPETAAIQRQFLHVSPAVQLPAEIAVLILAEFIRNPQSGFTDLSKTIARKTHIKVDVAMIQTLFEQHGLKKMIQTAAPRLGRH
jgi:hypothetical protein